MAPWCHGNVHYGAAATLLGLFLAVAKKKGHWHMKPEVQVHLCLQISFFGTRGGISGTILTEKVVGECGRSNGSTEG
eukprot:4990483-Ditylum_brightwellii.AAC.1